MDDLRTASFEAQTRLFFELSNLSGLALHDRLGHVLGRSKQLLGMERAYLSHIQGAEYTVEAVHPADLATIGTTLELTETYCSIVLEKGSPVAIDHISASEYADRRCAEAQGMESFVGTPFYVGGLLYGTLSFSSPTPRETPFTDADLNLALLVASWVGAAFENAESEASFLLSERRMETVLDTVPDAALVTGEDRHIVYANVAVEDVFGYAPAELIGLTSRHLYADPADYDIKSVTRYARGVDLDRAPFIVAYRRKDGSTFLGETVGGPINGHGGFIGLVRDVTTRETQRTATARAEARADAAEAHAEAAEAHADAVRSKERFLANMSHEMRTPLNAVLGLGHLLAQTPLSSNQADLLNGITTSADALLGLIDDLLDFARIGAGQLPFEAAPFSPSEMVDQVKAMLRPWAMDKNLLLVTAVGADLPALLLGDASRFRQILMNLTANAVKFTDEGSVTVSVLAAEDGEHLCIEIADTGIGIPTDRLEAIFEPFTQATEDSAHRYGGTGLGLAIVKDLIERQEGTITVESVEGLGSTFRVSLPLVVPTEDQIAAAKIAVEAVPADLSGLRVLVAEDNQMNRLVARRTLQSWGVQVVEASDGHEAVRAVAESTGAPFDLVLMDLQMPNLDGVEAARAIRHELGIGPEALPVVALTASVLAYQRSDVADAGIDDFVLKPFEPGVLRERIAVWTGRKVDAPSDAAPARAAVDAQRFSQTCLGDPDLAHQVTDLFLSEGLRLIETLAQTASEGDQRELAQAAHALKGQAGYVGALQLAETAETIVEAVRSGTTDRLGEHVQAAVRQYRTAANELKRMLSEATR